MTDQHDESEPELEQVPDFAPGDPTPEEVEADPELLTRLTADSSELSGEPDPPDTSEGVRQTPEATPGSPT